MYELFIKQVIEENEKTLIIKGVDQYSKEPLEYPECYAKFLIGISSLYRLSKDKNIMNLAKNKIERMLELGNVKTNMIWWGLPFDWKLTKKEDGFLITTSFCLKALILWRENGIDGLDKMISMSVRWIKNLYFENEMEAGFYYSPKLRSNIYNATAVALGVLCSDEEIYMESKMDLSKVFNTLKNCQKSGYWNYSKTTVDVDLLHQCYTVEGIKDYSMKTDNNISSMVSHDGYRFVLTNWKVLNNERYLFKINDSEKYTTLLKHQILNTFFKNDTRRFTPVRTWTIAALLRMLITFSEDKENITQVIKIIEDEIINDDFSIENSLSLKNTHKIEYSRNKYHLFESLCLYKSWILKEQL